MDEIQKIKSTDNVRVIIESRECTDSLDHVVGRKIDLGCYSKEVSWFNNY